MIRRGREPGYNRCSKSSDNRCCNRCGKPKRLLAARCRTAPGGGPADARRPAPARGPHSRGCRPRPPHPPPIHHNGQQGSRRGKSANSPPTTQTLTCGLERRHRLLRNCSCKGSRNPSCKGYCRRCEKPPPPEERGRGPEESGHPTAHGKHLCAPELLAPYLSAIRQHGGHSGIPDLAGEAMGEEVHHLYLKRGPAHGVKLHDVALRLAEGRRVSAEPRRTVGHQDMYGFNRHGRGAVVVEPH